MRVTFAKFPLLSKMQTLSCKLLVRRTSNHHHCNWYAQKAICIDFQVILCISSWSKTMLYIVRNKYGFQIGNAMGKINSVLILSLNREKLSLSIVLTQHLMQVINCWGIALLCAGLTTCLSTDCKTCTLLTSIHNDADNADDYNRDRYSTAESFQLC